MLRIVVACTGHRVPPIKAKQLETQSLRTTSSAPLNSGEGGISPTETMAPSKEFFFTDNDILPLSELDGIEALEQHWRDEPDDVEQERRPSYALNSEGEGRPHPESPAASGVRSIDHHAAKKSLGHILWPLRLKEVKEDWEREVLRPDLG